MVVECQNASPENIHMSRIMQTEKVIGRNLYVYTCRCMPVTTINEERGHRFEREQGRGYGKVCRKERKEEKGLTIS